MCGIAGFWARDRVSYDAESVLRRMATAVKHRGPDDEGVWWDDSWGVGLGHRRLSIIDLSAEGHQPMVSATGRYVIVYNGEVYNFREIRRELEGRGVRFRGGSDTEVMLATIECRGLLEGTRAFSGMFAFALFDRETGTLSLVRDRLGEKPLYYGLLGRTLVFGSELKALRAHPAWQGDIDRGALSLFLRHNYVPAPYSIYQGIRKVAPGTIVTYERLDEEPSVQSYWLAREVAENGLARPSSNDESGLLEELDELLRQVVRREMVADVPLGAFLSGGVDSSLIVALMQAQSDRPVRTFTIGFEEEAYNEADYARAVARHLGTDHTELYVSPAEMLAVVPKLPSLYDEPFADSSQVPTFLVSEMARRHVTVSLSGDGGDELFGGYDRYFLADRLRPWLSRIPALARRGVAGALSALRPESWDRGLDVLGMGTRWRVPWSVTGDRLHKLADVLKGGSDRAMYRNLLSHWRDPGLVVIGGVEPPTVLTDPRALGAANGLLPWMMYADLVSYLPDDILVKVDRASMGVSLESRAPYLDHSVVEFAWRLPLKTKVRHGRGKWIVRRLLSRYVPDALIERPKMGFGIPLDLWLRGALREWANALLEPTRLEREGYLAAEPVARKWSEHKSEKRKWHYHLWNVLMFQAWLEAQT